MAPCLGDCDSPSSIVVETCKATTCGEKTWREERLEEAPCLGDCDSPSSIAVETCKATACGEKTWREEELEESHLREAVVKGHSVLVLRDVATSDECEALRAAAAAVAHDAVNAPYQQPGKVRLPLERLPPREATIGEAVLTRSVERTSGACPGLVRELFGDLFESGVAFGDLGFSPNEPAVNVYAPGGEFAPHVDGQRLTVVILLSPADGFTGGGTAFWSQHHEGSYTATTAAEAAKTTLPKVVLKPKFGDALVFTGDVLHAALPVETGQRTVFVASFGPKGLGDEGE